MTIATSGASTPARQDYRTPTTTRNRQESEHPLGRVRALLERAADTDLPASAHGTLAALAIHMDTDGQAFPPQSKLARLSGLSERQVRRVVPQLERLGFFTRVVPPPRERALRMATVYQLRLPGLEDQTPPTPPAKPRRAPATPTPRTAASSPAEHRPEPARSTLPTALEVPAGAPAILEDRTPPAAPFEASKAPDTEPVGAPAIGPEPAGKAPDMVTKSTGHGDRPRLPMKSENAGGRSRFSPTATAARAPASKAPLPPAARTGEASQRPAAPTSPARPLPPPARPAGTLEDAARPLPADLRALVARIGARLAASGELAPFTPTLNPSRTADGAGIASTTDPSRTADGAGIASTTDPSRTADGAGIASTTDPSRTGHEPDAQAEPPEDQPPRGRGSG